MQDAIAAKLEADVLRRRSAGEYVGLGLAMYVEKSGLGPTDGVRINVDTDGVIEVITGGASVGQGFETVIAQVCAEMLGVNYRKVRVVHGRTDRIEHGIGAHATRATVMTANATVVAADKVRAKALNMAAQFCRRMRPNSQFQMVRLSAPTALARILASAISRTTCNPRRQRAAIVTLAWLRKVG